jgi:DNA-binding NarL/FixJ family response regulator
MKILLIDDHALVREGVATLLVKLAEQVDVLEAENCETALSMLNNVELELDLVLLDMQLPGLRGASAFKALRERLPSTPIVILSGSDTREKISDMLNLGAQGYIPKSSCSDILLNALRLVLAGGIYIPGEAGPVGLSDQQKPEPDIEKLTSRQLEVLGLICAGLSNKEIANQLSMAENTVRVHVASILKALHAKNRTDAMRLAIKFGLVGNPDLQN